MYTSDDLLDAVIEVLRSRASKPAPASRAPQKPPFPGPQGRPFLSEADVKKALISGTRRLTIPRNAIVSPLALDWIAFRGIEIVRE